jgi:flagella basal body P-ring formation protein FlgA
MRNLLRIGAAVALSIVAGSDFAAGETPVLPVPKLTVYPGDTITEDMLTSRPAQNETAATFIIDKQSLIGKIARRTLLPGQPIQRIAIREPYLVLQGKTVPVFFQSGTIMITGVALALESGCAGDIVSARNPDSGIVIRGVVQPDGSLRTE